MVAQNGARGAKAQLLRHSAAQFVGQRFQPFKERLDETKQLFARAGQGKRSATEQRDTQRFFELKDLRADCWLLNTVRNVAHRLADASVLGAVIEQLQVMDVHYSNAFTGHSNRCGTAGKRRPPAYRQYRYSELAALETGTCVVQGKDKSGAR